MARTVILSDSGKWVTLLRFEWEWGYGPWKTVYNRFNRLSKSGVINIIFNRLLSFLDAHGLVDWSATALDGSNIRALKCAAGAQKNIPILPTI